MSGSSRKVTAAPSSTEPVDSSKLSRQESREEEKTRSQLGLLPFVTCAPKPPFTNV